MAMILVPVFAYPFGSKVETSSARDGNIETITAKKDKKPFYRIVYTYDEKNRKVRGEYWAIAETKKKGEKKPQSNILAGTALAKKYEKALADSKTVDQSNVELDIEKDGFVLKNVRIVNYDNNGRPVLIMARGYTSYPVVGVFNLKTDYKFSYDHSGKLMSIDETNMNVDSVLLNMGIGNKTTFTRDQAGRPSAVNKIIGSVPPAVEETLYSYRAGDEMSRTIYRKCAFDTSKLTVVPSQTITIEYGKNVSWQGMRKYEFELGKTIEGIKIYDEVAKQQQLDISNFMKLSIFDKAKKAKLFYDLYNNEMQGPRWRMGELADIPEPFMIYKDYAWWN
jgi:hypothetical protein